MKSIKFILISFILLFYGFLNVTSAQWVQVSNGMGNKDVFSLAVSGSNIFAGTDYFGVYVSTNNGQEWMQTPLNSQRVFSLAVSGFNIFAGAYGSGVYVSTNEGLTWTQTSLTATEVRSMAVDGPNVYAGVHYSGVYHSTNYGLTWTQTSLNNLTVNSLAANGSNVFAGTYSNAGIWGIYVSTNYGQTWLLTYDALDVFSFAISGSNIFAGTYGFGVYLSTNNGQTWTQTSLNNQVVYSLAISGISLFAGTTNGTYISTNFGQSWSLRNEGMGALTVNSIAITGDYIYAGTTGASVWKRPLAELVGINNIGNTIPKSFYLYQNYPNPFNPTTKIKFNIPKSSFTSIKIYNILGAQIAILLNKQLQPGSYEVEWNASNYPSGVYYYKLNSGDYIETKKMILIK
jgi:hypothetical protein